MTQRKGTQLFAPVPLEAIDLNDRLTDFSLDPAPDSLRRSIETLGVTHPVALVPSGPRYRIACGHRRSRIARQLGKRDIPARILEASTDDKTMLATNLVENQSHRRYTDVEKGLALGKLSAAGVPDDLILTEYMPRVGLERSKKLLDDHRRGTRLTPGLQTLLHEMNVPLRVFSVFSRWDGASLLAAERFFSALRPGANKWRDLLEWIDETAARDEILPAELFMLPEIQSVLQPNDLAPNVRYDRIRQALYTRRYPVHDRLRKRLAQALDRLQLDPRTRVRIQDSFESDEIRIELKFRTREQLVGQVEKLARAAGSGELDALIRIFNEPE